MPFALFFEEAWGIADWELILLGRRFGELPNEVVERRPEVVQGIADKQARPARWRDIRLPIRVAAEDVFAGITVRLADDAEATILDESAEHRIQFFEVIPGPFYLGSAAIEGVRHA
jgi:hypothetical protein